jgi:hypothetical protein
VNKYNDLKILWWGRLCRTGNFDPAKIAALGTSGNYSLTITTINGWWIRGRANVTAVGPFGDHEMHGGANANG